MGVKVYDTNSERKNRIEMLLGFANVILIHEWYEEPFKRTVTRVAIELAHELRLVGIPIIIYGFDGPTYFDELNYKSLLDRMFADENRIRFLRVTGDEEDLVRETRKQLESWERDEIA